MNPPFFPRPADSCRTCQPGGGKARSTFPAARGSEKGLSGDRSPDPPNDRPPGPHQQPQAWGPQISAQKKQKKLDKVQNLER